MSASTEHITHALNRAFMRLHPGQAQHAVNSLAHNELMEYLETLSISEIVPVWNRLTLDRADQVILQISEPLARQIMQRGDPLLTSRVLARVNSEQGQKLLDFVEPVRERELMSLIQYPENSAGSLMDQRFMYLTTNLTAREVLRRIRRVKIRSPRQLYTVDDSGLLQGMLEMHKLALAEPTVTLESIQQRPVTGYVLATATREEVVHQLEQHRVTDLPVADLEGRLIGVIHYDALMDAIREDSSADMLTMFGASRDEKALSKIGFVVRKRLPWLSINLVTAFLAAGVVGLFENTIATFTALAVLLPVVAGQSGNTGAQALAVTMRALALKEIGTSQWLRVARKEVGAAFINGVAIALMTAAGVWVWSSSGGLALIIGVSMIIAMIAAAFSGVIIPAMLDRLGQDPAQSSSIILTTVTDVVGFFAFLGIATLLSGII
jgi:magnesium transporter